MSDQFTNKEKAIKGLLQGDEPAVNTDDLWLAIEDRLPTKAQRKRRLLPIWWVMGVMLLVGVATVSGYLLGNRNQPTEVVEGSSISGVVQANPNISATEQQFVDWPRDTRPTDKLQAKAGQTAIGQSEQTYGVETNRAIYQHIGQQHFTTIDQEQVASSDYDEDKSKSTESTTAANKTSQRLAKERASNRIIKQLQTEIFMPFLDIITLPIQEQLRVVEPSMAAVRPLSSGSPRPLDFRITGGLLQSMSATSVMTGSEFGPIHLQREKDRIGTDIGIDVGTIVRGWHLRAGFGYNTAITQYRRSDVSTNVDVVSGTTHVLIDEDGNSTAVTGDVETTITTYHDLSWYRRHSTAELRAGVGKDLYRRGLWSVGVEGTIGYAIQSSHQGYQFVDQAEAFVRLEEAPTIIYRKNMGWSAALGFPVALHLQSMTLAVAPTYRYNGNTFTTSDSFYQIRNSQIGIQFSITYQPRWEQF